jgi:HK97 family phage prohead protease
MSKKVQTTERTVEAPALSLRAAFQPASVNAEKRTVEVVWTTGARVLRGFWERFWEELSLEPTHVRMGRLNNGAPFLADHDGYRVASTLGVVESAKLEGKRGTAVIRFAKAEDDPEADKVFRKIRDGIVQNVSVGYRIHKMEKVEDGDDKIPVYRATDWEPYEISAVAMGADDGAGFRSEKPTETNPCVFTTRGVPQEERQTMDPEEQKKLEAAAAEEKRQAELKAAKEEAAKEERERASGIVAAVRAAKLEDSFGAKLIADGVSLEKARAMVIDQLAERSEEVKTEQHTRGIELVEDSFDKMQRGAAAWLLVRAGLSPIIERAAKEAREDSVRRELQGVDLDPGEFRGMSLYDLARETLERRGVKTRGMSRMKVAGLAFSHRGGGYATTSDFSVLFENVMHKGLLGAYATTPDTWSRFCGTDQVPDFRDSHRFRTGSFGVLDEKTEHGEFKNKSIPDGEKKSINVGTKGNIIAITREAIINDDMGALSDLTVKLGRAARLSIESDVYALLALNSGLGPDQADTDPFFHASRGNVGTGSALSVAGLDADRVVMASQMDSEENEYLDLRPAVLLVPLGLESSAKLINSAVNDPTANSPTGKPNVAAGMFRDIVGTPRITGTRRYMFADPTLAPAVKVVFLEGAGQAPVLESQEGFRMDGTEWKVRIDYRAQMFDPKGALTNAGT